MGVPIKLLASASVALGLFTVGVEQETASGTSFVYGVLAADPSHLVTDTVAGMRLAELDVSWAAWEPAQGERSSSYIASVRSTIQAYLAQGWQVAISPGFQQPPSWVFGLPDGQLIDQDGRASGTPDYEFSSAVQSAAVAYVDDLVSSLGSSVSYYRDGLSEEGEMLFPDTTSSQWWAFSASAQCLDSADLPAGTPCTPLPGWVPGTTTYDGNPITQTQVAQWWSWYLHALISAELAVIGAFRTAGYTGAIQLVMPGDGASPALIAAREGDDLAPEPFDSYGTMNTAADWQDLLADPALKADGDIVVDISSVGDGSGSPSDNTCTSSDQSVSLADADPWLSSWSDTRWITYLAVKNGFPVIGESPGNEVEGDLPAIASLVSACGLDALQWAWDDQLYDGVHVSASEYQAAMSSLATATPGASPTGTPSRQRRRQRTRSTGRADQRLHSLLSSRGSSRPRSSNRPGRFSSSHIRGDYLQARPELMSELSPGRL